MKPFPLEYNPEWRIRHSYKRGGPVSDKGKRELSNVLPLYAGIQEVGGPQDSPDHRHEALSGVPAGAVDVHPPVIERYAVG